MDLTVVVMAGGSGSRLWPLSRSMYPKQFIDLTSEKSMLQETLLRAHGLKATNYNVICNNEHRFFVAEQVSQLGLKSDILLEPVGRNTAPAIALSALNSKPDDLLLVLAADHAVQDVAAFEASVNAAIPLAESGQLVTFGIKPTEPHTGYGYIRQGDRIADSEGCQVAEFVEKPDIDTAKSYVEGGNYLWNSGMFLFKASAFLAELKQFEPEIYSSCKKALADSRVDLDFIRVDETAFAASPDNSIDYAVMEKTDKAAVVPMDAGWSDVGSWSSLWDIADKDDDGNATKGDVITHDSKNNYLRSDTKLVAAVGVEDLVVIDTKDAVMVAPRNRVQEVKKIVEKLKAADRPEFMFHREVYRPWGKYDSIDNGNRYQVKHITVKPGEKLSVQMHHHRAEHWIVVSGTANVTYDDTTKLVTENQSVYLPVGCVHALENPGKVMLELIEVQVGSYLGEDDIVRFEDRYGRAPK